MAENVPVVDAFDSGRERFAEAIGSVEAWNGVKSGPLSVPSYLHSIVNQYPPEKKDF